MQRSKDTRRAVGCVCGGFSEHDKRKAGGIAIYSVLAHYDEVTRRVPG